MNVLGRENIWKSENVLVSTNCYYFFAVLYDTMQFGYCDGNNSVAEAIAMRVASLMFDDDVTDVLLLPIVCVNEFARPHGHATRDPKIISLGR